MQYNTSTEDKLDKLQEMIVDLMQKFQQLQVASYDDFIDKYLW